MTVTSRSMAVDVVAQALRRCDPQTSGIETKAERIVEELEAACLLGFGRPVAALDLRDVARWL